MHWCLEAFNYKHKNLKKSCQSIADQITDMEYGIHKNVKEFAVEKFYVWLEHKVCMRKQKPVRLGNLVIIACAHEPLVHATHCALILSRAPFNK